MTLSHVVALIRCAVECPALVLHTNTWMRWDGRGDGGVLGRTEQPLEPDGKRGENDLAHHRQAPFLVELVQSALHGARNEFVGVVHVRFGRIASRVNFSSTRMVIFAGSGGGDHLRGDAGADRLVSREDRSAGERTRSTASTAAQVAATGRPRTGATTWSAASGSLCPIRIRPQACLRARGSRSGSTALKSLIPLYTAKFAPPPTAFVDRSFLPSEQARLVEAATQLALACGLARGGVGPPAGGYWARRCCRIGLTTRGRAIDEFNAGVLAAEFETLFRMSDSATSWES